MFLTSSGMESSSTFVFSGSVRATTDADSILTPKPFSYKDLLLKKRAVSKVWCFSFLTKILLWITLIWTEQSVKHTDGRMLVKTKEPGQIELSPLELCRRAMKFYGMGRVEDAFEQYDAVRAHSHLKHLSGTAIAVHQLSRLNWLVILDPDQFAQLRSKLRHARPSPLWSVRYCLTSTLSHIPTPHMNPSYA